MKIAFFHNLPEGGAKKVLFQQMEGFSKNHVVDLYEISSEKYSKHKNNIYLNKVFNYYFSLENNLPFFCKRICSDYKNFIPLLYLHKKIAKDIDNGRYDIVIIHPDKYTQAPYLLKYISTKNIYYCEEVLRIAYEKDLEIDKSLPIQNIFYETLTRKIRKNIDFRNATSAYCIFSNSKNTSKNIQKYFHVKSIVSYPGIDISKYKPMKLKIDSDILFIGEKIQIEGYELLSEALKIFKNKLKVKIINRRNGNYSLKEADLIKEYNKTKIVLNLSFNEPLGLIPLEAQSCGVPVIGLNEGGYKETIIDGKTGYLVSRNHKDLKDKIEKILSDDKLRGNLARNARKNILSNWSLKKCQMQLEEKIKYV